MRTLRVLLLSHMYPSVIDRNAGIFVHQQAQALLRENCLIQVISPTPYVPKLLAVKLKWRQMAKKPHEDVLDGIPVFYPRNFLVPITWFRGFFPYFEIISLYRKFKQIILSFKPDLVHAHTAPDGYVALMLKRLYGLPSICTVHGSDINIYPFAGEPGVFAQTKRVLLHSDQVIAVSNNLKQKAETIAKPLPAIEVVYNGCDTEQFVHSPEARRDLRARFQIPPETTVFLFVGKLLRNKGIFDLLAAFEQLHHQLGSPRLIIIGNGPEYTPLQEKIRELSLDNHVHAIGASPHTEMPKWMSAADVFVLPSHAEGHPTVVLEAMSCMLPVIATRVGGVMETVINGESGLLIDPGNVNDLLVAMQTLSTDANTRKSMGAVGRTIICSRFTWAHSAAGIRRVYNRVLFVRDDS